MRTIICALCLLFIFSHPILAEDLFVEVIEDTLIIHNTQVREHCAFTPELITRISDDTLIFIEKDTFPNMATCVCNFDFHVSLTGLQNGEYILCLYRQYSAEFMDPTKLYFISSIPVNMQTPPKGPITRSTSVRPCYEISGVESGEIHTVSELDLENYPNPANPVTVFSYNLPGSGHVQLEIIDITGRLITTLVAGNLSSGPHRIAYHTNTLASGVYICRLIFDHKTIRTRRFTVLR